MWSKYLLQRSIQWICSCWPVPKSDRGNRAPRSRSWTYSLCSRTTVTACYTLCAGWGACQYKKKQYIKLESVGVLSYHALLACTPWVQNTKHYRSTSPYHKCAMGFVLIETTKAFFFRLHDFLVNQVTFYYLSHQGKPHFIPITKRKFDFISDFLKALNSIRSHSNNCEE